MSEWWNGRHARFRIWCRKACEFESHLGYNEKNINDVHAIDDFNSVFANTFSYNR